MARAIVSACALSALVSSGPSRADEGTRGAELVKTCAPCHGLDGIARIAEAPNLAGQVDSYLTKALGDYRDGARRNDMMSAIAKTLSDAEIADLAGYYASIEVTVTPP